jgi:hypothetical protein
MFCPKCSQPQVSDETQYCPRCGLPLGDVKRVLEGGAVGRGESELSPRQRGVRQGATLMLLCVILLPAYVLLAALFPAEDRLVESSPSDTPFEKISQAVLLTIFMAGLARVLYARLFQRGAGPAEEDETETAGLKGSASGHALPPAQAVPVSGFGAWRADTGEMARRGVTEHTTHSLGEE